MNSGNWIRKLVNYARSYALPASIMMSIALIALTTACETSNNAEISYVPESERVYFIYDGDKVIDANGEERFILPYDGMVISRGEYFRMAEQ